MPPASPAFPDRVKYCHILVVEDRFNRWVKAHPAAKNYIMRTAKFLMRGVFPIFEIPD